VLPNGIIGWLTGGGWDSLRSLVGVPKKVATYPQLETDPEILLEREIIEEDEEMNNKKLWD